MSKFAGGFSTGDGFSIPLAEAQQAKYIELDDIERIKAFILDHTGFKVTNIALEKNTILTIKAIRKGSDK